MCVFFSSGDSYLDIKFVGHTMPGSHSGGKVADHVGDPLSPILLSEGACLIFDLAEEGFSHSFPSSTVRSNFVY